MRNKFVRQEVPQIAVATPFVRATSLTFSATVFSMDRLRVSPGRVFDHLTENIAFARDCTPT